MTEDRRQQVAELIRVKRGERGWRQADLAREAGVARSTINSIEGGRATGPYLQATLQKIANALELDVRELM